MPNTRCMLVLWATAVLLFAPLGAQGGESSSPENEACLACHGNPGFAQGRADGTPRSLFVAEDAFLRSVHGSASCTDCHAAQAQVPHTEISPSRAEWRRKIAGACAGCHATARDEHLASVHGKAFTDRGNAETPLCSDCHGAHDIGPAKASILAINKRCGDCHADAVKTYVMTYHGKLAALGFAKTATCTDCHGPHTILSSRDPASPVFAANLLGTCRKCHQNAGAGFATFQSHAAIDDFERYPVMWITAKFLFVLVVGALGFFWLHSALWFYREYRDRRERKLRPHVRAQVLPPLKGRYVQRWSSLRRSAHLVFALTVIGLVVTGVSLLYPDTAWAPVLKRALGGPQIASLLHKAIAVVMLGIFVAHLGYVAVRLGRNWSSFKVFGPYSLMPNWQDAKDFVAMFKWFFGRGPRPASDHWNYMQKVDYWAPFWGIAMLTVSGAMLWFNEFTARFLPGWTFNVATLVHGEEALLAAVYLFTIHYFSTHWRPDKFPLDVVMFTGSMPLEEFRRDYALEYDRLVASGQLERYLVKAPSRPMTLGSRILGFGLVAIGLVLLVLIAHGSLVNLFAGR